MNHSETTQSQFTRLSALAVSLDCCCKSYTHTHVAKFFRGKSSTTHEQSSSTHNSKVNTSNTSNTSTQRTATHQRVTNTSVNNSADQQEHSLPRSNIIHADRSIDYCTKHRCKFSAPPTQEIRAQSIDDVTRRWRFRGVDPRNGFPTDRETPGQDKHVKTRSKHYWGHVNNITRDLLF
jgi:hypothetical protein